LAWDSTILADRVLLPMNVALAACRRVTRPRAVHANRRRSLVNLRLVFRPLAMRRPARLVARLLAKESIPIIPAVVRKVSG